MKIRFCLFVISLLLSCESFSRVNVTQGGGVGLRYGGVAGWQVGVEFEEVKLNASVGVLGQRIGLERRIGYHQSLGVSTGIMVGFVDTIDNVTTEDSGVVTSLDYSIYPMGKMFSGIALTISYQSWRGGHAEHSNFFTGSIGYHF